MTDSDRKEIEQLLEDIVVRHLDERFDALFTRLDSLESYLALGLGEVLGNTSEHTPGFPPR